jgi:hypothetical protein
MPLVQIHSENGPPGDNFPHGLVGFLFQWKRLSQLMLGISSRGKNGKSGSSGYCVLAMTIPAKA